MNSNYYADAGIFNTDVLPPELIEPAEKLDVIVANWAKMPDGAQKSMLREIIYATMDHLVVIGKNWLTKTLSSDETLARRAMKNIGTSAKSVTSCIVCFEVKFVALTESTQPPIKRTAD